MLEYRRQVAPLPLDFLKMLTPKQRDKFAQLCPAALDEYYYRLISIERGVRLVGRVSGLSECPECGALYFDHPPDPFDSFLKISCDGRLLKI